MDISEFGAGSAYLDQNSSLQDEIGRKISEAYRAGFEFVYFDGSEGTNAPFEFHVPNAQYRVYKMLESVPLYCEGAAKAHFSWHFLSGGNAFDVFPPEVFKKKIDQFPAEEAPRMRQDFTRLNFGWWGYWAPGTQPDMIEYGTSRAAAWDCPVTITTTLDQYRAHPRTPDNLEVMRRWEDARAKNWLSDAQKETLRELGKEHILIINEQGEYELLPYEQIDAPEGVRAFIFERNSSRCVVYWHESGEGMLKIGLQKEDFTLRDDFAKPYLETAHEEAASILPVSSRRYLISTLSKEKLTAAFKNAQLV